MLKKKRNSPKCMLWYREGCCSFRCNNQMTGHKFISAFQWTWSLSSHHFLLALYCCENTVVRRVPLRSSSSVSVTPSFPWFNFSARFLCFSLLVMSVLQNVVLESTWTYTALPSLIECRTQFSSPSFIPTTNVIKEICSLFLSSSLLSLRFHSQFTYSLFWLHCGLRVKVTRQLLSRLLNALIILLFDSHFESSSL